MQQTVSIRFLSAAAAPKNAGGALVLPPDRFVRGAAVSAQSDGEWSFQRFLPGQAEAYREAGFEDFYAKTFATAGVRLAFCTDAASLSFDCRFAYGSSRAFGFFDIWVDGALAAHAGLEKDDGERHTLDVVFPASLGTLPVRVHLRHHANLA